MRENLARRGIKSDLGIAVGAAYSESVQLAHVIHSSIGVSTMGKRASGFFAEGTGCLAGKIVELSASNRSLIGQQAARSGWLGSISDPTIA